MNRPEKHPANALALCLSLLSSVLAGPAVAQTTTTADYLVVFDSTWSNNTHPEDFPTNPHFSPLVGGTHNTQVVFWSQGELASEGIERMAEQGATAPLIAEIQTAIDAGSADAVWTAGGIPVSPGSSNVSFTAHQDFPLLTLVSMLAPSPDWFVGVHSLPLVQGGEWVDQLVISLYVYDAGTDSGTTYAAPNDDTNPPEPITRFDTGFFAPPAEIVGTFTITRTDTPPAPVPSMATIVRLLLAAALVTAVLWRLRLEPREAR